uniref:Uncharacterized protein n=1 Tax=Octactis speculum TaxID=3111310 RepID=A0A7S2MCH3_9STRA|mmetsp:Transcript_59606/g.81448  ORF Transcript_59606/g.81448 Transcript_59606/m.81448 type:complete len:105 (+) Transcript_59606:3-317(+)
MGDLEPVFKRANEALEPKGWFAFSSERIDTNHEAEGLSETSSSVAPAASWKLQTSGRFAHSKEYLEWLAESYGMEVRLYRKIVPRLENGVEVPGQILVLQKRGT